MAVETGVWSSAYLSLRNGTSAPNVVAASPIAGLSVFTYILLNSVASWAVFIEWPSIDRFPTTFSDFSGIRVLPPRDGIIATHFRFSFIFM